MANDDLPEHHRVWLDAHPHWTREWFKARTAEGFDVHHLDGNHSNNVPDNLVLIEHTDHMMIHGGRTLGRLKSYDKASGQRRHQKRPVGIRRRKAIDILVDMKVKSRLEAHSIRSDILKE